MQSERHKDPHKPQGLAHPEFSHEGVRFSLTQKGELLARLKNEPAEKVATLTFNDTGRPWIPRHKGFTSICKGIYRERNDPVVEGLRKRHLQHVARRSVAKRNALEMFHALERIADSGSCEQGDHETYQAMQLVERVRAEIRKAGG